MYQRGRTRRRLGVPIARLLLAVGIVFFSLITYFGSRQDNPVTGEAQFIGITVEQEIALGLQAAPELAAQFGGLDPNESMQSLVDRIGDHIVQSSPAYDSPYEFEFHLLDDKQTINAFALPGGQIFITRGLFDRIQTEGELAGVLAHEVGHVIGRHSAEQIAKAKLTEGLTGAVVIASYDPDDPQSAHTAQMAAIIGQLINLKFGREDELESDFLGVCFMEGAGYDPSEMENVMKAIAVSQPGGISPEFFSTHPNPERRTDHIRDAIQNIDQCP